MTKRGEGRIAKTCAVCGATFETYRAWERNGKAGQFCSRLCKAKGCKSRGVTIIKYVCEECGALFARRKGHAGQGRYCSIQCMATARGRAMRGDQHWHWMGGITKREWAGRMVIRQAIRAIGKCEECGSTQDLQGHHVIPVSTDRSLADKRENVKVLCKTCHAMQHPALAGMIDRSRYKMEVTNG